MFVLDAVYGQVMSISEKDVANFYDNYADRQKAVGFNLRQYTLVEKLIDLGMSAQSNVLEIGCGVGQVSALIAGTVTNGQIVSCDISPKSIEEAKKECAELGFKPKTEKFGTCVLQLTDN